MSIFDDFDNWNPRAPRKAANSTPAVQPIENQIFNAASRGQCERLTALLAASPTADLHHLVNGFNALHIAAKKGHCDIVKVLLERDPSLLRSLSADERDAFMLAAFEGHVAVLQALLASQPKDSPGDSQEQVDRSGNTCLHYACWGGSLECVKFLVDECGKDANAVNRDRMPPLQFAAAGNHSDIVQFLLMRSLEDLSCSGMNALHRATVHGSVDTVKLLVEQQRYDPTLRTENGMTALHFACKHGHEMLAQYLCSLEKVREDVDRQSEAGLTALHFACICGNSTITRLLLLHGADPKKCNSSRENALHLAAASGRHEICQILRKYCISDVFNGDSEGKTPVEKALDAGFKELANSLVLWSCIENKAKELRLALGAAHHK